jgi:hypothetical protein
VHRAAIAGGDESIAPDAESHLSSAHSSSGTELPPTLRTRFESALGSDLGGVRVHTGDAPAAAANAVGAHAYTIGQDVYFGAGKYDPSSQDGQRLIAHEVVHTVQQSGDAHAQFKLEVSSPGDAAEVEADRVAETMIGHEGAGAAASTEVVPRHASRSAIHRVKDSDPKISDDDKQWATGARDQITTLQTAASGASSKILDDGTVAVAAFEGVHAAVEAFHDRYTQALKNFVNNVSAAAKKQKELEDNIELVADATFILGTGGEGLVLSVSNAYETASNYWTVEQAVVTGLGIGGGGGGSSPMPGTGVDWAALTDGWGATIASFKSFLDRMKTISTIRDKCESSITYLSTVIEGSSPTDAMQPTPQSSGAGQTATKFATNGPGIATQLDGLPSDLFSKGASKAKGDAEATLGKKDIASLEHDIAVKWMSDVATGGGNTDDIYRALDSAKGYFQGLGVDIGLYESAWDRDLATQRAIVEEQAKEILGQVVVFGNNYIYASVPQGFQWPATLNGSLEQAKQNSRDPSQPHERVTSYTIAPLTDEEKSNWRHGWTDGAVQDAATICRKKLTFVVTPLDQPEWVANF